MSYGARIRDIPSYNIVKLNLMWVIVVKLFKKLSEVAQHIYSFGMTRCIAIDIVFIQSLLAQPICE